MGIKKEKRVEQGIYIKRAALIVNRVGKWAQRGAEGSGWDEKWGYLYKNRGMEQSFEKEQVGLVKEQVML